MSKNIKGIKPLADSLISVGIRITSVVGCRLQASYCGRCGEIFGTLGIIIVPLLVRDRAILAVGQTFAYSKDAVNNDSVNALSDLQLY